MSIRIPMPWQLLLGCAALFIGFAGVGALHAERSLPDLTGNYQCAPDPMPCARPTYSVAQSGSRLDVKTDAGERGSGQLTSSTTISLGPPWNVFGTIRPDQRTIEWSAGTLWRKQ